MEHFLFLFFSLLTLLSATSVIISKNPIHSVLFLVLVFFNVASLLIFIGVEFLALLFLIVYVGAVAVLFLFIIMMLSVKMAEFHFLVYRYLPIGVLLSFCFLWEISHMFKMELTSLVISPYSNLSFTSFSLNPIVDWSHEVVFIQNIHVIASVLYTHYAYLFVIAGIILLVSMIGAITLTLHRRSDIKRQHIYQQVQQEFAVAISWKK